MAARLSLNPRVQALILQGLEHHRAGRTEPAGACYRSSLKVDPRCSQALHLLGLLAQQAGNYQESLLLIGQALALNPNDPDALNGMAESHLGQNELESARRCLQRVADLRPNTSEAHHRLGKVLEKLGEWEPAEASYQRALALAPNSIDILASLARVQCKLGAFEKAVESSYRALVIDAGRVGIYHHLGHALTYLGHHETAAQAFRKALTVDSRSAESIYGLGYILERQGQLAAAAESYQSALKLDPRLGVAHLHLGVTFHLQGNLEKAIECAERLQQLEPKSADARSFLGIIHLQQGNFAVGSSEYEDRWNTVYGIRHRRKFSQPLWKGELFGTSRILLYAEQGLGDTLQFVRYVPRVAARGGRITLEVQPRLLRLLSQFSGVAEVIASDTPLPQFDWQCPLLSLPLALGTELNSIPADIPYIKADPVQINIWREKLKSNSLRVGLVWGGSPKHPHEIWRCLSLGALASLMDIDGATFYSLQMGPPADQISRLGLGEKIIDLQDQQVDFADTAAIVANLDLVISIDTSVAHLAGAMGKPVWVLLSKSPDWRWLLDRDDSPWYPTARLFRQPVLGNWQAVVKGVNIELRQLIDRGR